VDVQAVRVDGEHEVLTLHGMIMEYKFDDLGSVYAGSPFIAAIQHRLADALENADAGHRWRDWRDAAAHPHRVEAVHLQLSEEGKWWDGASEEQRATHVRNLLAPLRPAPELLSALTGVARATTSEHNSRDSREPRNERPEPDVETDASS
jgi:hypothetical protein